MYRNTDPFGVPVWLFLPRVSARVLQNSHLLGAAFGWCTRWRCANIWRLVGLGERRKSCDIQVPAKVRFGWWCNTVCWKCDAHQNRKTWVFCLWTEIRKSACCILYLELQIPRYIRNTHIKGEGRRGKGKLFSFEAYYVSRLLVRFCVGGNWFRFI